MRETDIKQKNKSGDSKFYETKLSHKWWGEYMEKYYQSRYDGQLVLFFEGDICLEKETRM